MSERVISFVGKNKTRKEDQVMRWMLVRTELNERGSHSSKTWRNWGGDPGGKPSQRPGDVRILSTRLWDRAKPFHSGMGFEENKMLACHCNYSGSILRIIYEGEEQKQERVWGSLKTGTTGLDQGSGRTGGELRSLFGGIFEGWVNRICWKIWFVMWQEWRVV